jgi:hypothetical protein
LGYFFNFQKTQALRKQSPIGQKFSQSCHPAPNLLALLHGDQNGRIFAQCAIVYVPTLGRFLKITEVAGSFSYFSTVKAMHLFLQNGLGYIFADFFTSSSGHPGFLQL